MPRKIYWLVLFVFCMFFFPTVKAYEIDGDMQYRLDKQVEIKSETCESILGDPEDDTSFAYFLQEAFTIIQWAGPVLCVILSLVDFVKAVASQDKDAIQKAIKTSIKRFVFAVLLFFLPMLVNFLLGDVLGWYGTCGIK